MNRITLGYLVVSLPHCGPLFLLLSKRCDIYSMQSLEIAGTLSEGLDDILIKLCDSVECLLTPEYCTVLSVSGS